MRIKTSIPKLHSIKFKTGPLAENVVHIRACNHDVPVINVLHGAAEAMLTEVVLVGYDANGSEYLACSTSNLQHAAYMFARAHLNCLREVDSD